MESSVKSIPPLPTVEQLENAIKEFEAINWAAVDIGSIDDVIPWALKAMSIVSFPWKFNHYLYRVRPYHSFRSANTDDNVFQPKSFSYPPKGTLSRAGTIEFPVFYCASNLEVALLESKSEDSLNFLGCWHVNEGVLLNVRPFLSNIPGELQNSNETFIPRYKQSLNVALEKFLPEQRDIISKLDDFHDRQFVKEGTDIYKYSSWVAYRNLVYGKIKGLATPDAIMFQSVLLNQAGTNLAIDPDFVDRSMALEKVYLISHKYNSMENRFERLILSVGETQEESIIWKAPSPDDFKEFQEKHHGDRHIAPHWSKCPA
jgi:hypothetical protein